MYDCRILCSEHLKQLFYSEIIVTWNKHLQFMDMYNSPTLHNELVDLCDFFNRIMSESFFL